MSIDPKTSLKRRNYATLAIIIAFIALLYCIGIVKLRGL